MRIFDQLIVLALQLLAFVVAFDDVESYSLALPSLLGSSGFVAVELVVACPLGPVLCPGRTERCTHLNLVLSYLKSATQYPKNGLILVIIKSHR